MKSEYSKDLKIYNSLLGKKDLFIPIDNKNVGMYVCGPTVYNNQLSLEKAEKFYETHSDRPFFNELVAFMSRGPIIAAILEKDNAVEDFRELIGSTNPSEAKEGTIRNLFATSMGENAVHGSDSNENAKIEGSFHFKSEEILP